jgi:hypothetical protein
MKIRLFQSKVGWYEAECESLEELSDKLILHNVKQNYVPMFGRSITGDKTVIFNSALRGYVVNPTK